MIANYYRIAVALLSAGMLLLLCAVKGEDSIAHPVDEAPRIETRSKATDKDFLYGNRKVKDWYIHDACRRFPLWLGKLRNSCIEYTGWSPQRPWWWLDEAHETLGSKMELMQTCIEKDFLEYMKTWPE
jgi:hypothetical protein